MPEGVPWIQSRMWSQALLAADRALLIPRICTKNQLVALKEGGNTYCRISRCTGSLQPTWAPGSKGRT